MSTSLTNSSNQTREWEEGGSCLASPTPVSAGNPGEALWGSTFPGAGAAAAPSQRGCGLAEEGVGSLGTR